MWLGGEKGRVCGVFVVGLGVFLVRIEGSFGLFGGCVGEGRIVKRGDLAAPAIVVNSNCQVRSDRRVFKFARKMLMAWASGRVIRIREVSNLSRNSTTESEPCFRATNSAKGSSYSSIKRPAIATTYSFHEGNIPKRVLMKLWCHWFALPMRCRAAKRTFSSGGVPSISKNCSHLEIQSRRREPSNDGNRILERRYDKALL